MKKTILLAVATMFATLTFAQQQLATLSHNDTISVYYGATSLQQAYNASADGDIITLSSGTFNSPGNITKAITLRGAGMYADTVTGSLPTIISGDICVDKEGTQSSHVILEGMRFNNNLLFGHYSLDGGTFNINYLDIIKCGIQTIAGINFTNNGAAGNIGTINLNNAMFINCIIQNIYFFIHGVVRGGYQNNSYINNSNFINCAIIASFEGGRSGLNNTLTNCVVGFNPDWVRYHTVSNSILFYNSETTTCSSQNAFYCIGINGVTHTYFDTTIVSGQQLRNYGGFSEVFKDFNGTYTYGSTTFELNDSIASTCLGVDGTQMGIYGGTMPFDPFVRHPLVRRCNVASRSTADGKLAVDIEIVSE